MDPLLDWQITNTYLLFEQLHLQPFLTSGVDSGIYVLYIIHDMSTCVAWCLLVWHVVGKKQKGKKHLFIKQKTHRLLLD